MAHQRYFTAIGIALVLLFSSATLLFAEPLGLVTVRNSDQAVAAEKILNNAFARTGNRFLVAATHSQLTRLELAGLEFETILSDADPQNVYQVFNLDHPRAVEPMGLRTLGEITDLGHGLRIMSLSRAAAASVAELGHLQTRSLDKSRVRFKYQPPVVATALADEYPADILAERIDLDSLYAFDQHLVDFGTRYCYTPQALEARDWMVQKFRDWGYTVTTPRFYDGGWLYNVKAVKIGVAEPDKVIVIGGHYDSIDFDGDYWTYAPGADDDGSGTALTMEVARVLADVPLRKTVIFMPFTAEEVGLLGSADAASDFAAAGTKLEVMYNYDMVGYTDDDYWDFEVSSGDVYVYRNLSAATANRITELTPLISSPGFSSDHYSFEQEGFNIVNNIEADFNYPGWHTDLDLTSEMNFEYFTEVAKMAVVSLAIVADAAYPAEVNDGIDPGDGQSLLFTWDECSSDCDYTIYWGEASGTYTDSAAIPAGQCEYTVTGLTDGQVYYAKVVGESPNGYRALYAVEGSGVPLLYPRTPADLAGESSSETLSLLLTWAANQELDFSHYNLYRRYGMVGTYALYATGLTSTSFIDDDVLAHVGYDYAVTAVDLTGYESGLSESVMLYPASFDGGWVVADGFVMDHNYDPDQAWQEAWLDTVMSGVGFGLASADEHGGPITLSDLGEYSAVWWLDDDLIEKNIGESEAALTKFAQHNTNMLISGYRTFTDWSPTSVPASHLLYQEFGLTYYQSLAYFDFIGSHGQNGWPSVEVDRTRGPREWPDIAKLSARPGATIIGTFDSFTDLPGWEGEPVGLAYETANGKRVLLSFPLFYMTPASATALMTKVIEYFGTGVQYDKGDLDHSGTINLGDIALLLDHLFISQQPLPDPEVADMDGRPGISIGDVFILIDYLFLGGPQPVSAGN